MTPLQVALDAIRRGWSPIPVSLKTKRPTLTKWQNYAISEADAAKYFSKPCNVGAIWGEPSGRTLDIDLDCREAVHAAKIFLPKTGATYGRKSNRASHYLYASDLCVGSMKAVVNMDDPARKDKKRIAELRIGGKHLDGSNLGAYSVIPGSVHESGEPVEWEPGCDGTPAEVSGEELRRAFFKMSACTLMMRYFPEAAHGEHCHGGNEASLALGGVMARGDAERSDAEAFMDAICDWRGYINSDVKNFTSAALRSFDNSMKGDKTYGLPKLIEHVGQEVAEGLEKWLQWIKATLPAEEQVKRVVEKAKIKEASGEARRDEPLVLDRGDPNPSARMMIAREYTQDGMRILLYKHKEFYRWDGTRFKKRDRDLITGDVWRFMDEALHMTKNGHERFKPIPERVAAVTQALMTQSQSRETREFPYWSTKTDCEAAMAPPHEMLACANGLLHMPTRKMFPHTPAFRNTFAVGYNHDDKALPPTAWLNFLNQIWENDAESIGALQELFGLLLTNDTSHQKIFLIIGPPRCGKGTIARVLSALVGGDNVAAPTLSSLGEAMGLQPLIGKTVAVVSDARLGGSADAQVVTERLLSISGEDEIDVRCLYTGYVRWKPTVRFVIMTNVVPKLSDASSAMSSRFITLQLTKSFLGHEDHHLTERLVDPANMPGLLNWALEGLRRLQARGRFVQPKSGEISQDLLKASGNPIEQFVLDRCDVGEGYECQCTALYTTYVTWCDQEGIDRKSTSQNLGVALHAMAPTIGTSRRLANGKRTKWYTGIAPAGTAKARNSGGGKAESGPYHAKLVVNNAPQSPDATGDKLPY